MQKKNRTFFLKKKEIQNMYVLPLSVKLLKPHEGCLPQHSVTWAGSIDFLSVSLTD